MIFRTDRQDLYRRVAAIARDQGGYFTAAQAKSVGYSYQAQRYHLQRGNWVRVDRGLFLFPEWPELPDASYWRWHLWAKGKAVLSHETAAEVHGLLAPGDRIHLTVPQSFRGRADGIDIHVVRLIPALDCDRSHGFAVTTVSRTIVDLAMTTADPTVPRQILQSAIDAGTTTPAQITNRAKAQGEAVFARFSEVLDLRTSKVLA